MMIFTQIPVRYAFLNCSVFRAINAAGEKKISVGSCLMNTIPYINILVSFFAWIHSPNSIALKHGYQIFLIFGIAVGRIWYLISYVSAAIIVNHVTHQPFPTYSFLVFPFTFAALITRIPIYFDMFKISNLSAPVVSPLAETIFIYALLIALSVEYALYASTVIEQFCDHLGIKCLSIPLKPVETVDPNDSEDDEPRVPSTSVASRLRPRKRASKN